MSARPGGLQRLQSPEGLPPAPAPFPGTDVSAPPPPYPCPPGAGYVFGNVPAVHDNFSLVVLGIVVVSVLPVLYEVWAAKREAAAKRAEGGGGGVGGPKLA